MVLLQLCLPNSSIKFLLIILIIIMRTMCASYYYDYNNIIPLVDLWFYEIIGVGL